MGTLARNGLITPLQILVKYFCYNKNWIPIFPISFQSIRKCLGGCVFERQYLRTDPVKFVEDCLSKSYPFKFFKACLPQILLGPFLNLGSCQTFCDYDELFLRSGQSGPSPAGTIVRDPHHCKSPTRLEQGLNLRRT